MGEISSGGSFALVENPASAGIVGRDAADKSLAAARDYR